ncbi:hypothetical protein DKP78_20095, partial [Enterococcus faecium]
WIIDELHNAQRYNPIYSSYANSPPAISVLFAKGWQKMLSLIIFLIFFSLIGLIGSFLDTWCSKLSVQFLMKIKLF